MVHGQWTKMETIVSTSIGGKLMGRISKEMEELEGIELERFLAKRVIKQIVINPSKVKPYLRKIDDAKTAIEIDHIRRDAIDKLL